MSRIRANAKSMRKEPTVSEARIWSWLRNRHFGNHKFRRQHPVAGSILDFYCAELKLAIEVDGKHHETSWMNEYDGERTKKLAALGITVVRVPNEILAKDSQSVVEIIQCAIERAAPHPAFGHPLPAARGEGNK